MLPAIVIAVVFAIGLCLALRGEREDPAISRTPYGDHGDAASGARHDHLS
jgi:hypothetical protein